MKGVIGMGVGAKSVQQIGIVVRDIDRAIEHWLTMGVPSFEKFLLSSSRKTCGEVFKKGKRHAIEASMAVGDFNGVQVELIQPLDDQSVYYDFLQECGEGLHHLSFDTAHIPFDELSEFMRGNYGDPVFNGIGARTKFAYYDCREEMGLFVEIMTKKPESSS